MTKDMGAPQADGLSQAEPVSRLGPSGFDPSRGDAEMLAILMWDYFGPQRPRSHWKIEAGVPKATPSDVGYYRECAKQIADSLRFYRNIEFDAVEQGGVAQ